MIPGNWPEQVEQIRVATIYDEDWWQEQDWTGRPGTQFCIYKFEMPIRHLVKVLVKGRHKRSLKFRGEI